MTRLLLTVPEAAEVLGVYAHVIRSAETAAADVFAKVINTA
jgi:hypothetical protein